MDKVSITLRTTAWDKNANWSEANAKTDNGWTKKTGALYRFTTADGNTTTHTVNRTIRIREYNMYRVDPIILPNDYKSLEANSIYYTAEGVKVTNAKKGDVVYKETMIDQNLADITTSNASKGETVNEPASPGLTYLFTKGLNADGDAVIYFKRPYDYTPDFMDAVNWTRAPEYTHVKKAVAGDGTKTFNIFSLNKTTDNPDGYYTDHQPLTLNLPDGEFVTSYTLDLGPYGGDADATAETARAYDGDAGSGQAVSDYEVLGRPYIYKGQANKLYTAGATEQERRFAGYIDNALSTAHVDYNRYYAPIRTATCTTTGASWIRPQVAMSGSTTRRAPM